MEFKHGSSGKPVTAMLEISEHSTDQGNMFNVKVGHSSAVHQGQLFVAVQGNPAGWQSSSVPQAVQ